MNAVFDSDFLIDYLEGVEAAREFAERFDGRYVSIVSFIEVLTGATSVTQDADARAVLGGFEVLPLSLDVAERAVALRRSRRRLRTPDAVVWATAQLVDDCVLVTRNTRDFPPGEPGIVVPYSLGD